MSGIRNAWAADLTLPRAQARGVIDDPNVRQELMKLRSFHCASEWTAERAKAARALGKPPGSEGSIGSLRCHESLATPIMFIRPLPALKEC